MLAGEFYLKPTTMLADALFYLVVITGTIVISTAIYNRIVDVIKTRRRR